MGSDVIVACCSGCWSEKRLEERRGWGRDRQNEGVAAGYQKMLTCDNGTRSPLLRGHGGLSLKRSCCHRNPAGAPICANQTIDSTAQNDHNVLAQGQQPQRLSPSLGSKVYVALGCFDWWTNSCFYAILALQCVTLQKTTKFSRSSRAGPATAASCSTPGRRSGFGSVELRVAMNSVLKNQEAPGGPIGGWSSPRPGQAFPPPAPLSFSICR